MKLCRIWTAAVLLLACGALSAWGTAPAPVAEIATVDDLVQEIDAKIKLLTGLLETPEKFEEAKTKDVWQGFGVISVMGQSLVEHSENTQAGFSGAAIRDAALKYQRNATHADAQAALTAVTAARNGEGEGEADVPWNKLIRMHPMMEELNSRNAKLAPIFKRPRGKPEESRHATVMALLSLAMYADTHEVKNETEIPAYQQMATDYRTAMVGVAGALRNKDGETARELFDKANATCDACHEKFRDAK